MKKQKLVRIQQNLLQNVLVKSLISCIYLYNFELNRAAIWQSVIFLSARRLVD